MTIYIDKNNKCYVNNGPERVPYETTFFDNKCKEFIEGYLCIQSNELTIIRPWKQWKVLNSIQKEYEQNLIKEQKEIIAELDAALLDAQYNILTEGL